MGSVIGYGPYAGKINDVFVDWRESLAELATCPNVYLKVCPTMIRLATFDYGTSERPPTSEQLAHYWKPYVETAVELFGPSRCMVESNFPVEKIVCGYATIWNTFKRVLSGLLADEKRQVFSQTAIDFYRLDLAQRGAMLG
jgi:predicted TIM-barrel fold metal-dependent hydrolase